MNTIKYIIIDIIAILLIVVLGVLFQEYFVRPTLDYILFGSICVVVGMLFEKGTMHGLTIGMQFVIIIALLLYFIGGNSSTLITDILSKDIIYPMLPIIPIGLLAGLIGAIIKKRYAQR